MLEMLRRSAPPPWRTAYRCTLFYSNPHFEILPHSPQPLRGCGLLTTAAGVESDSTSTSTVVVAAAALLHYYRYYAHGATASRRCRDARRRATGGRPGRAARGAARGRVVACTSCEHSAAGQGVSAGRGACVREVARTGTVYVVRSTRR
eukprot:scaffold1782_cov123-Isochrysis_galbana.AAC.9